MRANQSTLTRRRFLEKAGMATAISSIVPTFVQAQQNQAKLLDKGFARVEEAGKGIYAIISDLSKGAQTLCNGGFVIGRESILVIEGFASPAGAAFAVEAARSISQLPIKAALVTHHHFDHSFGSAYYGGQSIPLMSHPKARELFQQQYVAMQGVDKRPLIRSAEEKVEKAVDAQDRQHAESDLKATRLVFEMIDNTVLAIPNQPLRLESLPARVDLGGIVAVLEAHPGHSPGDIIVRIPDQNITFAGDLVFQDLYPVCIDADMSAWRGVMEKFASWGPSQKFVPGHGPVCGQAGIRALAEILDDLKSHARRMFEAKASVEEAQRTYRIPDKFKNWSVFAWGFSMGAAMQKYYGEFGKSGI